VSFLKLGFVAADWTFGYWLELAHRRAKGQLLLFDRHYIDLLADPKRYRYGGPMWLAWLLGRLIPRPDLFVFLDLPAELAHARKPEVPLDEARRLRDRYLALARSLSNARVVDASRPLDEVVAEVERLVLDHMAARTRRRLGLDG
jgi:thymidylate kinase